MTKEERKKYMKAWHEAHKEQYKAYQKAYQKAYRQAHKEEAKAYYQAHKEEHNKKCKDYYEAHKEEAKAYYQAHKEEHNAYQKSYYKSDLNSLGQTKQSIRNKSCIILNKSGIKIPGYQIHHCFTYDDPSKFIYCSKEMHLKIHQFLRDNNIDADSNHCEQIKHLLDDTVVVFGV